jgi:formylmethanofuran dehydrogenase subunit E
MKKNIKSATFKEVIKNMDEKNIWEKCVAFHGHECGGLTIGFKAALYAIKLLGLKFSKDEEVVCVSENDACGVDAVQVILGCSIGRGNLLFHMTGKQAFSFYNRKTGKSVRLVLKKKSKDMTREESFAYYQGCKPEDMFDVKEAIVKLPEHARLFSSVDCECCGETVSENYIRMQNGKHVCLDCFSKYNRFSV